LCFASSNGFNPRTFLAFILAAAKKSKVQHEEKLNEQIKKSLQQNEALKKRKEKKTTRHIPALINMTTTCVCPLHAAACKGESPR
jgi:hypothetical protein